MEDKLSKITDRQLEGHSSLRATLFTRSFLPFVYEGLGTRLDRERGDDEMNSKSSPNCVII